MWVTFFSCRIEVVVLVLVAWLGRLVDGIRGRWDCWFAYVFSLDCGVYGC